MSLFADYEHRNIFEDDSKNTDKLYLITNNNAETRTLLPLATDAFIEFFKKILVDLEIEDDCVISFKRLRKEIFMNENRKIESRLKTLFKTNCLEFKHTSTNSRLSGYLSPDQYFNNIEQLLIMSALMDKFILKSANKERYPLDYLDMRREHVSSILTPETDEFLTPKVKVEFGNFESFESMGSYVNENNHYNCSVIYNTSVGQGLIIGQEDIKQATYLVEHFNDFKLIKAYDSLSLTEVKEISSYFHKRDFVTTELIIQKLQGFETLFDIGKSVHKKNDCYNNGINNYDKNDSMSKNNKNNTIQQLETTINLLYDIHTDINSNDSSNNMIKASEIINTLSGPHHSFPVNMDKLKLTKLISSTLLSMGLNKKRKSDGIYYYNIRVKPKPDIDANSQYDTDKIDTDGGKTIPKNNISEMWENENMDGKYLPQHDSKGTDTRSYERTTECANALFSIA